MHNIFRNIATSLRDRLSTPLPLWEVLGVGLLLLVLSLSSCKEENSNQADLAAETAKAYYEQLLNGDIAAFVEGTAMHVEVVPSYREQLETNMKMFLGQQERDHKGIKSVKKVKGTLTCPTDAEGMPKDTAHLSANAFLIFNYGDNTSEQVVVPLVRVNGIWLMR